MGRRDGTPPLWVGLDYSTILYQSFTILRVDRLYTLTLCCAACSRAPGRGERRALRAPRAQWLRVVQQAVTVNTDLGL